MTMLPFISGPDTSRGDEYKYFHATRLTEKTKQELDDFAAENNISKTQLIREAIYFLLEYYPKVIEMQGGQATEKMKAASKSYEARRLYKQRRVATDEVIDLLTMATETDHAPLRAKLKLAARQKAKAWDIEFPPPDVPLLELDKNANYVLERVHQLMNANNTNRVTLNELNPRIHKFNAKKLRSILKRLEEHGYIETSVQVTSGPETLWIIAPTLNELVNS